jgi:uncharacterized protein with beta-barrel porin domain
VFPHRIGSAGRLRRPALIALLLATTALPAAAQDATWLAAPNSGDMQDAANWSSGTVPTGTATFGASTITSLTLGGNAMFGGWTFAAGAPAYAITTSTGLYQFWTTGIEVNGAIPTLTNNGTIQFFSTSSAGSAAITNNGALLFYDTASAGSATITNAYGMTLYNSASLGSATVTTSNSLYFYNDSTAGNATIANTGIVNFLNASSAGTATITNNGSLYFQETSTAGSAAITNNTFLTFSNASSAGSAAITNNGSLHFQGTSTAGSAVITNTGSFYFANTSTAGSATITNSSSTFNFFGSSTAANATIFNTGTLRFQDSSTAGSATINNTSGAVMFRHASTAGSATILNDGGLGFLGSSSAGNAIITGNGGISFLDSSTAGSATITSTGAVQLFTTDTAGAATVTIQNGGSLIGTGAVGNTTIEAGGTFRPEFGTLFVNGNLTLNSGATYVFVPTGLASVTGTASLDGKLQFRANGFASQNYTVLTAAGGVSGSFTLEGLYGSAGHLIYGANDVTLVVDGYRAGVALGGQGTRNTINVAAGLDAGIAAAGGTPPAAFNALIGQSEAGLANALNGLSGEAATGAQANAFGGASTFLNIMLDPMAGARGATAAAPGSSLIEMADTAARVTPAARVEAGWSVWTKAYGQAGRSTSDAGTGAAGTGSQLYGVAAGADRLISADTLVGFALAGGGSNFGLTGRGSGTGDFFQAGLYGSTRLWDGYVSAAAAYGWNRYDVSRTVTLGITETYTSSPVAHTLGGRVETGRRFGSRAFGWTPYAAAEAIGYFAPAYAEGWTAPNTGVFALAYGARTTGTVRTELGVRLDGIRAVAATADLVTFGRLAYGYQAFTQRSADAQFQALANSGFTVFGARASAHTMLASLGTEVRLAAGTRATASLDGELGERHRSIRANLGLRQSW